MKQLDRLIEVAKRLNNKSVPPVHIIEDGRCHICEGKCEYLNHSGVVIFFADGLED